MNKNTEFKPYIPAEKITPELTVTSVIMGCILAVIFGAANAYLGLRVGMTVSASIPAAVISMGVIRVILRRNSILESNMVQTIGSAGESLAAGAIFTMPALFLWAEEGLTSKPGIVEITLIALCGGILGVLFMVPLRNALIVKEHATLLYPEGTACADVLLAGEEGGANASTVFSGMGLAAVFKFVVDGLKLLPADVSAAFKSFKGEIGMEVYPALLGVGYIVGPKIASYMFTGSLIGWRNRNRCPVRRSACSDLIHGCIRQQRERPLPSFTQTAEHQRSGLLMLNISAQVLSQQVVSFP